MKIEHTENYYKGDFIIEGVLANNVLGIGIPLNTAETWQGAFVDAIKKARDVGMTEEEIEYSIRLNLCTYGFDDSTFPVEEWMNE